MNRSLAWGAAVMVVIVIGAAGGYYGYRYWRGTPPAPVAAEVPPAPVQPPANAVEPATHYPIGASTGPAPASLPSLAMSDSAMRTALTGLIGEHAFAQWWVPESIIRRIVVTVDNLPRARMSAQSRPVRSAPGSFLTEGADDARTIAAANAARYAPYVDMVRKLDIAKLAELYRRNYVLFQQAYEELGYPRGYFNDRLVQTIDDLLAAPEVSAPIALVQPEVMYRYADPQLEALSAGQKILVRMGRANAAIVKLKLRELRQAIVDVPNSSTPVGNAAR